MNSWLHVSSWNIKEFKELWFVSFDVYCRDGSLPPEEMQDAEILCFTLAAHMLPLKFLYWDLWLSFKMLLNTEFLNSPFVQKVLSLSNLSFLLWSWWFLLKLSLEQEDKNINLPRYVGEFYFVLQQHNMEV